MSSKARDLIKLSGVIAVAFGVGLTFANAFNLPRSSLAEARPAALVHTGAAMRSTGRAADLPSFADVVERVNPSVVYVQTSAHSRPSDGQGQQVPPEFQDFFRRFQQQQPRLRQASGTGFIVTRDGYILTNNHVVADADRVTVRLLDNREFNARVVGRDANTDVAVIKIDADNLPAVSFGSSDQARVGDWVLAFGNPLGFTFTVTSGIVSAKGRQLAGLRDPNDPGQTYSIQDFIQTDAAINPGNSGGPLVNMNGEVIGINSAIASSTGLYAGYGFAIPISLARRVMDDLISKGHVDRAILGINISDVGPNDAAAVGLTDIHGVLVRGFPTQGQSPAQSAGLELGDVIVAVNDTTIDHVAQLQQMVGFRRPGEQVRVTIVRRESGRMGVRHTFAVRLVAAEDSGTRTAIVPTSNQPSDMEGRLGLRIEPISDEMAHEARLSESQSGVLVTDVEEGGPSYQQIGTPDEGGPEMILQVNDTRVKTVDDFKRALRAAPAGSVVQLRVMNLRDTQKSIRLVNIRSR
ncbi:MAG TPA: Do family serine endopeptidase [Gemmatimonadales bacterium]|jgi:serine protease Do